ncbi:hypothetical protein [Quatrionicoccus australiensis]|uniref:hypothetical protein n=1 Tax=Quatrionicoccus australiensis TaxID=138118 RepID=UPI001CFA68DE|nr:hypothetical protein [Quatrionicoccus australiensis]MCB4359297.1 hypothetical protein [Quatrionicoccus australiensis]
MTGSTLNDGVTTRPATATDLATFTIADQQLNGFTVPKLYDSNGPHVRVFFVLSDGTGNDAINDPQHINNEGLLWEWRGGEKNARITGQQDFEKAAMEKRLGKNGKCLCPL